MKVIKVGTSSQSRIAQACDRYVPLGNQEHVADPSELIMRLIDAGARRYAAMALGLAVPNAPTSASNVAPATSLVVALFLEDIPSRSKRE